jgi:hypothetical protein|tara:strand:+ start:620 stop:859 length:240 start_codon:yes stop_codon:yes gene_type:complete
MWNKIKGFLIRGINMLTGVIMALLLVAYGLYAGVVMTLVLNDLRLDTYVGYSTGAQLVLLVFLLVWVPYWGVRKLTSDY